MEYILEFRNDQIILFFNKNKIILKKLVKMLYTCFKSYIQLDHLKHTILILFDTSNPIYKFILYYNKNEIIGFVRYRITDKQVCYIDTFCVCSKHRGKGIGSKILNYIKTMPHLTKVKLSVLSMNKFAVKLYQKHGFVITKTEKNKKYKSDVHSMELSLAFKKS